MSKLTRVTASLFGSATGTDQIEEFGSYAAGSPVFTSSSITGAVVTAIQSLSAWAGGWYSAIVGAESPVIQDMNAIFIAMSYFICYQLQQGIAEWDSGTTYFTGSLASSASGDGNVYISLSDNNLNNPLSESAYWKAINGAVRNISTSGNILTSDDLVRVYTGSGPLTVTLPSISTVALGRRFTIKCVGTNPTTVQGYSTQSIDGNNVYPTTLNYLDSITVMNSGAGWDVI